METLLSSPQLVLVADAFPPLRSSGAVQLRDLVREFAARGVSITVLVASPGQAEGWKIEDWESVQVARLKTLRTKDASYAIRLAGELLMPFAMMWQLHKSPLANMRWDGVVWYSPTIFLGPIAHYLKRRGKCRSYLILRDIFPEWVADVGLIGRGVLFRLLKLVANYQYAVADVIGIQSPGNKAYLAKWLDLPDKRIEILQNWLAQGPRKACSIRIAETPLAGRKIMVYAGNMGIAQGMDVLLALAARFKARDDLGFVFVGRGSEASRLAADAKQQGLTNTAFFNEIDPDEIPALYEQCHIGLFSLDPRHKTHNIPGKFLSYMLAGLPVLASVNNGNDIIALIHAERVGFTCTDSSPATLAARAEELLREMAADSGYARRCQALASRLFSPEAAVKQILAALRA